MHTVRQLPLAVAGLVELRLQLLGVGAAAATEAADANQLTRNSLRVLRLACSLNVKFRILAPILAKDGPPIPLSTAMLSPHPCQPGPNLIRRRKCRSGGSYQP